jgi:hypothetical protein
MLKENYTIFLFIKFSKKKKRMVADDKRKMIKERKRSLSGEVEWRNGKKKKIQKPLGFLKIYSK